VNINQQARVLVREVLTEDGIPDIQRVIAICDYVEKSDISSMRKTALLKKIRDMLVPIVSGSKVVVETSATLDSVAMETLKKFVEKSTGRTGFVFVQVVNPDLLGGVRIKCGDTIWERSAKLDLSQIR